MQIGKVVSLLKVSLFISLALLACQAKAEFYEVTSEPEPASQTLCTHVSCDSCDGQITQYYWLSTDGQDFDSQSDRYKNLYINGAEGVEDEYDASDFNPDRRTGDDVGSDLEIN